MQWAPTIAPKPITPEKREGFCIRCTRWVLCFGQHQPRFTGHPTSETADDVCPGSLMPAAANELRLAQPPQRRRTPIYLPDDDGREAS